MKATQRDFAAMAPKAARECSIFFFCGPDEAGASAAAEQICELIEDPGERVEIAGSTLRKDPAVLGDEARSVSLFGGARHIVVRAVGEEALEAIRVLIETNEAGAAEPCKVIVIATSASDKSRTAKLLEKRPDALVAMFYPPDLASVTAAVRRMADAAGLRLGGDLAERIARASGLDLRLARSEIEKLAIYCDATAQSPKSLSAEDLEAAGAACEDDGFAALVNAVMGGQLGRVDSELRRMREIGMNPVGLLLAIERRAALLAAVHSQLGPSANFDRMSRAEKGRLGIFFKEEREIRVQLMRWRPQKLERLVVRLMAAHRQLLANSHSAELFLAQELAEITRFAARR